MIYGFLAEKYCGVDIPVEVLQSAAGYYIGTEDNEGPVSRESVEYWDHYEDAVEALRLNTWTQRVRP